MPEHEPTMNPEVAAALRAYEVEVLDGTQRSQEAALKKLRAAQRRVGMAAIVASAPDTNRPPKSADIDDTEAELAAG